MASRDYRPGVAPYGRFVVSVQFDESHDHHPELTIEEVEHSADEGEAPADIEPAVAAERDTMAAHGDRAVRQAMGERAVVESGGEDGGIPLRRYVRYFLPNSGPLPWCAFFVSWAFDTTGDRNHRMPWENPGYVGSIQAWARARGRLVSVPQRGDIFGFGDDHCGLVVGVNASRGTFTTIEGNYGDRVTQRSLAYRAGGVWFARM